MIRGGIWGSPGEFPFTRGVYPSMYRGRLWTMRQFAGFGTAAETNERFRYLLEHGQTGLSTAFDMPTLMGYDSDHPRSEGEVGREGVGRAAQEKRRTYRGEQHPGQAAEKQPRRHQQAAGKCDERPMSGKPRNVYRLVPRKDEIDCVDDSGGEQPAPAQRAPAEFTPHTGINFA